MTEANNILQVHQLSKQFTLHILHGKKISALSVVSFEVKAGEFIGLTGSSGAGKSTLMKCLYRTYLPTSGEIWYYPVRGERIDLAQATDHQVLQLRKTEIKYCAQFLQVIPRVTAEEIVAREYPGPREEAMARARNLLDTLFLPASLWDAYPATFSGGEQQRVNVAQALISQPRLLLIDEPTASLDARAKDRVIEQLLQLKAQGTAVICISHDTYTLERLADRQLNLSQGSVQPSPIAS